MLELMDTLIGGNLDLLVAGALGGVVRWLCLRDRWLDGLISVVVGAICAIYLHALAIPIIEPTVGKIVADPDSQRSLSGFLLGLGGISVSGFILDVWTLKYKKTTTPGNNTEGR